MFHHPRHLSLQSPEDWCTFFINDSVNEIHGLVHYHVTGREAKSPYRSPFGSFLFSDKITDDVLRTFVQFTEQKLRGKGVFAIQLKSQPEVYSTERNKLLYGALLKTGYSVVSEETSAVIFVSEKPFEAGLHLSKKQRLRKSHNNNLMFRQESQDKFSEIYRFIEKCRDSKGYELSMTQTALAKLMEVFPDQVVLSGVNDQDKIIAAGISIRVNENVLYNFYYDHAPEYDHLSPVVLLHEGLYGYCQQNKIGMLDLGTSNPGGKLNKPLLDFKIEIGAKPSPKYTFTKQLA